MTSLVFPLIVNMAGIPVISIIIRYNLEREEGAEHDDDDAPGWRLSRSASAFVAHVLPWILMVPFNTQNGMNVSVSPAASRRRGRRPASLPASPSGY